MRTRARHLPGRLPACLLALALAGAGHGAEADGVADGVSGALAGIGHSRGAVLDQVEGLASRGTRAPGGAAVITGLGEVVGVGDRVMLLDAPFDLRWQSGTGGFALAVRRIGDDPSAASRADARRVSAATVMRLMQSVRTAAAADFAAAGEGRGRIRQGAPGRYEIRIEADGAWRLVIARR